MGSTSTTEADYAAFQETVKRTVFLDNLSPQVTESVLRTALGQFGAVKNVEFIPNYIEPNDVPCCALVEMQSSKVAAATVSEITQFPFMIAGMPRPVRALAAEEEMFDDRPVKPGRRLQFRWLDPSDPDFEVATKMKNLVKKHAAEDLYLFENLLEEEEKLAKVQDHALKSNYRKFETIDSATSDGTARNLAHYYNMRVSDD